jgi:hypothetical protein
MMLKKNNSKQQALKALSGAFYSSKDQTPDIQMMTEHISYNKKCKYAHKKNLYNF